MQAPAPRRGLDPGKGQTMKCVICKQERRYINETRPCCRKCEKTAPMCVQAPGLFTNGPAGRVARATEKAVQSINSTLA